MARSVARFEPTRMSVGALRRAAVDTLQKLRFEFGLSLQEREKALDVVEQLVHELALRAASPSLFDPDLGHGSAPGSSHLTDR